MIRTENTSYVLAAPEGVRKDQDIYWYELEVTQEFGSVTGSAFNSNGKMASELKFRLQDDGSLKTVYYQNQCRIVEDVNISEDHITVHINEQKYKILISDSSGNGRFMGEVCLNFDEKNLLSQWSGLSDHLTIIGPVIDGEIPAQANDDEQDRSCTGCALEGLGVSVAAGCCVFSAGCCATALIGGGHFIDNCKGACAGE